MWIAVQLAYHHYSPNEIKNDTLFMNRMNYSTDKEIIELWTLDDDMLSLLEYDDIIENYGYPVLPYLIDENNKVIAEPYQLGWWDAGDIADELIPFGIKEMNFIMQEFDGLLEVFVDEELLEKNEIEPIFEEGLVIMRFLTEDEEYDQIEE